MRPDTRAINCTPASGSPRMRALNLHKFYGNREVVAKVGLEVARGEIIALLGPNGAGKTTVMSMMTGVLKPDGGTIDIDGQDVTTLPIHARARLGLSYLPQEDSVFSGLSVQDNIMLYLESAEPSLGRRRERLEAILAEFGLDDIRRQRASRLSGGQRRRCEIARALAVKPAYILLDEPFAGVDPLAIAEIKHTIAGFKARGMGVLITDHNVRETLSLVDYAYILVGGHLLVAGTPEAIKDNSEVRQFYLGSSLD